MDWKCSHCGTINQDLACQCVGCGFSMAPLKLIFFSRKSGKSHPISIKNEAGRAMMVGRDILKILDDPDLKYVDKYQFSIVEFPQKGILIKPVVGAINKIFLNGNPLPEDGVLVAENDLLSINGKFFFLDLKLSY